MSRSRDGRTGPRIGLVSPTPGTWWLGGLHYVQHLVHSAVASGFPGESFRDVWWGTAPEADVFAEIRDVIGSPVVVSFPTTAFARARRAFRRKLRRTPGAADLFEDAGIDVLFPILPVEDPGIPFVFLLTDFQYRNLPHYYTPESHRGFEEYNRSHGARATIVLLSSRAAEADLRRFMPELAPKTEVIFPVSVPDRHWFSLEPAGTADDLGLPERFFVISNQICRHKNHITVARAVRRLRDRGVRVHIVCTGRQDDYRDPHFYRELLAAIEELGVADQFTFTGVLPRAQQIAVMRRSVAALQPSEFEGWGAAVADAKALGKTLLASDLPVHREHHAAAVEYLDVHDDEAWAAAIERFHGQQGPGPHEEAERAAAVRIARESIEVGSAFVDLLRRAAESRN